jgi:general stress protein YciG
MANNQYDNNQERSNQQRSNNPGNFKNDPQRASEAGRKGGKATQSNRRSQSE